MSVAPRMTGIVSETPQRPRLLGHAELLARDLGVEQDENERLWDRVKDLKKQLATAKTRIAEREADIRRLLAGRPITPELIRPINTPLTAPRRIRLGRLVLNLALRTLELRGVSVNVTRNEMAMLTFLATRPDSLFGPPALATVIGSPADGNAIYTYMSRLRPKLQQIGAANYLQVRRGHGGYWMTAKHEATS